MSRTRILLLATGLALGAVGTARADQPPPLPPPPVEPAAPVSRSAPADKPLRPTAVLLDPVPARRGVDYAGVERAKRSDPRFARLTLDLRDGRVVIGGTANDPAAGWELAAKVAPLVGGRDVVVGRVAKTK